jgi:acetylornithine aminotransferase
MAQSHYLMPTYEPLEIGLERGEGAWVWDAAGKRYLDAIGGIAVSALGHAHPKVTEAICDQAQKILHTSNLVRIPNTEHLAKLLVERAKMENVFFANSGAEANECALKLARLYGHKKGIAVPTIIVMENAFHGRTLATLSASGNRKIQAGFEPLVQGFLRVPFDDITSIQTIANSRDDVVAVMLEPIQGEAGVLIPKDGYLRAVREICDKNGWLMILDEIQSGMGRTGLWFEHQREKIVPDIMTLAKALGNGFPIGACLARGEAATLFAPGNHGSTFGGNPLATRVGATVIEAIEKENLLENSRVRGEWLLKRLQDALLGKPRVVDVRGRGLWIGIKLDRPCRDPLLSRAAERGLIFNIAGGQTIRLAPPLIVTQEQVEMIANIIIDLVLEYGREDK